MLMPPCVMCAWPCLRLMLPCLWSNHSSHLSVKAIGDVLKSVKPGQMVVKIVHDALVETWPGAEPLNLNQAPPAVILMVGLQGGGKTTSSGKLALLLRHKHKKTSCWRP